MKVLLLYDSMGVGGAETHVAGLAKRLAERGVSVVLAAKGGAVSKRLLSERGDIRFVEIYPSKKSRLSVFSYADQLRRLIDEEKPDIVHAHSRMTSFGASLARRFCRSKFSLVVTAHAMYRAGGTIRLFSRFGDRTIAVSDDIARHLVKKFKVGRDKISVISNGIDVQSFRPLEKQDENKIVFASRLDSDCSMGAYALCSIYERLLTKHPNLTVDIIGGGSELDRLKKESRGKYGIRVLGGVDDLSKAISGAALIIGVSRVALEGMACQKNVILYGNEGALGLLSEKNILEAEKSNFTCRGAGVKGADFLFSEIEKFLSKSKIDKDRQAAQNRRFVIEGHSEERAAEKTLDVYRSSIERKPKALLCGYYGFGNMGDEALLRTVVDNIKDNAEISVLYNPNSIPNRFDGINYVDRASPFAIIRAMLGSDFFILGGGSLLQNETSLGSLVYYCTLIILSKLLRCKCIAIGNGLGELRGSLARRIARFALKRLDHISLRDRLSMKTAEELGIKNATRLGADVCFAMENSECEESERVKEIRRLSGGRYFLVALKGDNDKKWALDGIREYSEKSGEIPVFVAMDREKDGERLRCFAEQTGGIYVNNVDQGELFALIEGCTLAIGERLHLLIFALVKGKRIVGIGDSVKIRALVDEGFGGCRASERVGRSVSEACYKAKKTDHRALIDEVDAHKSLALSEMERLKRIFN